jgi:hypothetical protein
MLVIEGWRRAVRAIGDLPAAARVGLLVMAMGAGLSASVHAFAGAQAHALPGGQAAHLVSIAGMVVVWVTVVLHARRPESTHRAAQAAPTGGASHHAHR